MAELRFQNLCLAVAMVMASIAITVEGGDAHGSSLVSDLGVNWGVMSSHRLPANIVVQMLKDNGIRKVKLFDADSYTVNAFAHTGIDVMVAIPNNQLLYLSDAYDHAKDWVQKNVTQRLEKGVDIRYVAVGNEPFLKSYNNSFTNITVPALQYVQRALEEEGIAGKVKATVPLNADVYESSSDKPSDGHFRNDIKDVMIQMVKFLNQKDSPFVVNIYPFLSLYQNPNFPLGYAFFHDNSRQIVDKNATYTNVFDANYDTLVWTLAKAGFPNMKIIVGEIGWPTDGNVFANSMLAKRFYDGLFEKLGTNKGTPLRPGKLDVYLFGLIDEDEKSVLPGHFERHWGIFRYDGQPKFAMDLNGQGKNKMPVGAKGVEYLPQQWCVWNPDVKNDSAIADQLNYACTFADCTSLGYGSSCNGMDLRGNVSYAFNMYFQSQNQDVDACDFNGVGVIVKQNASQGTCFFPVQIVSQALPDPAPCVITFMALALAFLPLFFFI